MYQGTRIVWHRHFSLTLHEMMVAPGLDEDPNITRRYTMEPAWNKQYEQLR